MGNKDIVVLINGVPLPKDDFEKVVAFISNLSKETSKEYQGWLEEIYENGFALKYVPEDMRTFEICDIAVKQNGNALQWVSKEFREELAEKYDIELPKKGKGR